MPESHITSTKNRSNIAVGSEKQVLELEALFEISQLLSKSADLTAVLNNIMYTIMGRMMISKSAIILKRASGEEFYIASSKGLRDSSATFKSLSLPDETCHTAEITQTELKHFLERQKLSLSIPLQNEGNLIGIFCLGNKLSGESYTESERSFLSALGRIASSFIQKNITVDQLKESNALLDKRIYQLTTLLELGQKLNETTYFDEILRIFSRSIKGTFLITKLAVLFENANGHFVEVFNKGFKLESHVKEAVAEINAPTEFRAVFSEPSDIAVVIPLETEGQIKGFVLCGQRLTGSPFDEGDLAFLDNVGNTLVSQLTNAQLVQDRIKREVLEQELELARKIQRDLLPAKNPSLDSIEIVGSNQPSRQVGGDYFDFIPVEDDWLGIAIGDVSGKGAAAAMLMSNLQASMQALSANRNLPITDCISSANSIIYRNTSSEKYITFFYGELNEERKKFRYVNAGHNYPILLRGSEIIQLRTGGLILGMMDGLTYETEEVDLEDEDILVFYTDGITEAMDKEEEEFDEVRLIETVKKHRERSAADIHDEILKSVFQFCPNANDFDDITLIVLKMAAC